MCLKQKTIFFYFLIIPLFCIAKSAGATPAIPSFSFVHAKASGTPRDTTRRFKPALVLAECDTSLQNEKEVQTRQFYEKLRNFFYQTKFSRKFFDLLFVPPSRTSISPKEEKQPPDRFKPHEGKVIGDIHIRKLPVFGPSVTDTSARAQNWLQKAGNSLHFPTRSQVIRKNLLIEKGDSLQPFLLSDNERVLRQLPFIRDARLYLQNRPGEQESDTLDILILTQDYFAYEVGGSFGGFDDLSLRLDNNNLAGLGHLFSNELTYNEPFSQQFGYRGVYTIPNLAGLFIKSQLEFTRTAFEQKEALHLRRDFYTPDVKWAGGLHLRQTNIKRHVLFLDARRDTLLGFGYTQSNAWLARAFSLSPKPQTRNSSRLRLVLAGKFTHTNYNERPTPTADAQHYFHHRHLLLGSIGLNSRRYFRDHYIFGFGRTEDVPVGYLLNMRFGYEKSEFDQRPYLGFQLQAAHHFMWFGYLRGELDAESFFRKNGGQEQSALHVKTTYFSPLLEGGSFHFRQLISIDYTYGNQRLPHEFLTIGNENIRGLHTYEKRGTQRFSLRLETISFTPFNLLGFQLAVFGFADLAFLNRHNYFSLKGQSFQGYGLGLRVRNDHLTFNTFQLRAVVYPNTPGKGFGVSISGIPSQLFKDFEVGEPRPFLFR